MLPRVAAPRRPGCTAIAAANDMLAVGCYAALFEAPACPALMTPLVGFNDMPFIDRLQAAADVR